MRFICSKWLGATQVTLIKLGGQLNPVDSVYSVNLLLLSTHGGWSIDIICDTMLNKISKGEIRYVMYYQDKSQCRRWADESLRRHYLAHSIWFSFIRFIASGSKENAKVNEHPKVWFTTFEKSSKDINQSSKTLQADDSQNMSFKKQLYIGNIKISSTAPQSRSSARIRRTGFDSF